jgi:biotin transport system substrate-specific component
MPIATPAAAPQASLSGFHHSLAGKALIALSASLVIAIAAHISFPLPFTPVPLTLSDLAVVLVGLFLSPASAFAAVVLYLAEGASGLPVFNPGGLGGVAQLVGPTGGYLFAYPFAALATSVLVRVLARITPRFSAALIATTAGSAFIMLLGFSWLAVGKHISLPTAFVLAVAPFLPGQIVKILSAAGLFTSIQRLRKA